MIKLNQHLIWIGLSILMVVFSAVYLISSAEVIVSEYANYKHARTEKAVGKSKWLPSWLPESATNIREVHSIDTNQVWLEFRIDSVNSLTIQGCELILQSEYKEKLPNMIESLAIKMGYNINKLVAEKDAQLYVCEDNLKLKWGVIFQANRKSILSWNSVAK